MIGVTGRQAIERAMGEAGVTQLQLARAVGLKHQSNVSEALKRDMKISLVAKFAEAMGYELVLQKKKPGRKADGQIVIDGKEVQE